MAHVPISAEERHQSVHNTIKTAKPDDKGFLSNKDFKYFKKHVQKINGKHATNE